ncbi:hypothetical protein [Methylocystis sp. Sn-Cys]|uniref:hypothetical protein n=1 Tax=Methylocystis sp. Sn-Cys TaxID=1701263 RepID=UPI001925016A|nr:hypothetical protein [Methylocystis sp. Sn-Cys]MBL1258866.1 hypothetical protein [Methylocystis sp. Sn-Cys]
MRDHAALCVESHKFRFSDTHKFRIPTDFPGFGGCSPPMKREAGPTMKRENPTPEFDFSWLST